MNYPKLNCRYHNFCSKFQIIHIFYAIIGFTSLDFYSYAFHYMHQSENHVLSVGLCVFLSVFVRGFVISAKTNDMRKFKFGTVNINHTEGRSVGF